MDYRRVSGIFRKYGARVCIRWSLHFETQTLMYLLTHFTPSYVTVIHAVETANTGTIHFLRAVSSKVQTPNAVVAKC